MQRLILCFITAVVAIAAPGAGAQAQRETFGDYDKTYGMPENVSTVTGVDVLYNVILWMTVVVGIGVFACMALFIVQYRYRDGREAKFIHGNNKLETVWTLIPTVILALTAALSQDHWTQMKLPPDSAEDRPELFTAEQVRNFEVVQVDVIGKQFKWYFHYPGEDGVLGRRSVELVDFNAQQPDKIVGLDRDFVDPRTGEKYGADDFVTPQMFVPVRTRVYSRVTSIDVLHSFFLPNFRVKQDAVPGMLANVWFESTRTSEQVIGRFADQNHDGTPRPYSVRIYDTDAERYVNIANSKPFDIVCAELCGQGHYTMAGQLFVLTRDQYRQWYQLNAAAAAAVEEDPYGY